MQLNYKNIDLKGQKSRIFHFLGSLPLLLSLKSEKIRKKGLKMGSFWGIFLGILGFN